MRQLTILPNARDDLRAIEHYSIQEFGASVADYYMNRIERALDRLLNYPESGPLYPGIRPPVRYVSVGSHHLFYDFDGKSIAVLRVLHQAMVPEDWL
jgi:toxin ParE1/3/4